MKKRIPLLLLCLLLTASLSAQRLNERNYQRKCRVLNDMFQLSPNCWIDKWEISILDWMEYQFWLERIYGKDSEEYRASLPDTDIIARQYPSPISENIRRPVYVRFPMCGIDSAQARAYCRWRTDRVAESMLVLMKRMEYDEHQTPESAFSVEKYENTDSLKFPYFDLPTKETETRYGFRCVASWRP